jgi:hypothetical protein
MLTPREQTLYDALKDGEQPIAVLFDLCWPNFDKPITPRERQQRLGRVISDVNMKLTAKGEGNLVKPGIARGTYALVPAE